MSTHERKSKTGVIITAIICATFLGAAGIGAFVYVNQQDRAQQKELREKEINAENERAQKQRDLEEEKSRRDCRAQAESVFSCL